MADDVRYYGKWMRDEAEKRIGHLYPKVRVSPEMIAERPDLKPYLGRELTVIAWLWARTVKSPNPAFRGVDVPLASTFMLSTKTGKEAWVHVEERGERSEEREQAAPHYSFTVRTRASHGAPPAEAKGGTKLSRGANFECVMSGTPIAPEYIYAEANAGRMGARLMAIVAEGDRGRVYLSPTAVHEGVAAQAEPTWKPDLPMPANPRWFSPPLYGLMTYGDLFTPRQLVALTTFSDLVGEAMGEVRRDALAAGLSDDPTPLRDGGTGALAYAEAVGVYLGIGIDKATDYWCTTCSWHQSKELIRNVFSRQAIPMTWDYAETNGFSISAGNVSSGYEWAEKALRCFPASTRSTAETGEAQTQKHAAGTVVSTDPPYYDNIGYADLSDFFYVWLRRSLRSVYPDLFATMAVPKAEELVATPYRHGSKAKAESFFLEGMKQAMHRLAEQSHPALPVTIYYAFKQAETLDAPLGARASGPHDAGETPSHPRTASTGWETFLDAVIRAGFGLTGTWPMRTELGNRMVGSGANALASSIVLVCRQRADDAPSATRREFVAALKAELPGAIRLLQGLPPAPAPGVPASSHSSLLSPHSSIAPVDLAQAAIGPGMAVYTRYAEVLDAGGEPVPVREALALINQVLDETLAEQEGDFDADTRWALAWFEQSGFDDGDYGVAETLSKAKNTSVQGMVQAGIAASRGGKVRLLRPSELPADWDPEKDKRLTVWETVHHLVRVLEAEGEAAAAELVVKLGSRAETARELAYRLYTICERKRRAAEALSYNGLVRSWAEVRQLAAEPRRAEQGELDLE